MAGFNKAWLRPFGLTLFITVNTKLSSLYFNVYKRNDFERRPASFERGLWHFQIDLNKSLSVIDLSSFVRTPLGALIRR